MRRTLFWPLFSAAGEESRICAIAQPTIPAAQSTRQPAGPELGEQINQGNRSIAPTKLPRPIDSAQVLTDHHGAAVSALRASLKAHLYRRLLQHSSAAPIDLSQREKGIPD